MSPFYLDGLSRGSRLLYVRALVVFGESVIDAVNAATVAADVGDELFCSADCASFQVLPCLQGFGLLKSCLRGVVLR